NATLIGALPYSVTASNADAGLESGEVQPCAAIDRTVWFSFTPATNVTLMADTFGSSFDTGLAVYEGTTPAGLTLIDCDDDAVGLQSAVIFNATAGTTYYFQAGGFAGDQGSLHFHLNAVVCGDGVINGYEECDDANLSNGDGCDSNCFVE